jgi:sulfur carrier protein
MIKVNGATEALATPTVAALLEARGIAAGAKGVAVALNGAVVPRTAWAETTLSAGDAVEIIKAMSGG